MRKIAATFSIIFAVLLSTIDSASAGETKLQVKVIDVDSINRNQIDPDFLAYLDKYKRGMNLIAENLPNDQTQFKVVIERPIFKEGFLGHSYEAAIRGYPVTKEEMVSNQKQYGSSNLIVDSFVCAGYLPGERVNLFLLSNQDEILAKTSLIPNPLEKTFSDGKAKITMEYLGGEASWYTLIFSGFNENEEISFQSISGTEEIPTQKLKIKNMAMRYSNGVVGAEGGKSIVTFTRNSGKKVVFVLPWGNQLRPYLEGKVAFGEIY